MDKKKEEWKRYASALKDEMMFSIIDPTTKKFIWGSLKYKETLYETPKTFKNNFAFNDGTWLRFPKEYRTKNGKAKGIFLKDTKSAIIELFFFCRFQSLLGVSLKEELVYHMICFISDVVNIYGSAFDCNQKNKDILYKIAERILTSEVPLETHDKLKDTRAFCIDPMQLKVMDKKTKASMQAKGKRISNYINILKKYDENKSISQNAIECGVCISTIKRFNKVKEDFKKQIKNLGLL